MSRFYKQLIFITITLAVIISGGLVIYSATPGGNLKIVGGYQQYGSGRPVAWWKMDEASWNGTAGEVVDSIGTNNGTSVSGANTTSTAVFGRAGSFDGGDDYVNIPDNANLRPSASDWSVSAWAKLPNSNQMVNFVSKRQNSAPYEQYSMSISDGVNYGVGKKFNFSFLGNNVWTKRQAKTTVADVVDGNWHLYTAVVIRGSDIKLYVDGVEKSSTWFYNLGWPDLIDNTDPLQIGVGNTAGYTNGSIDDVRIYNYALTANQVKQIYNETAKIKMVKQENTTTTGNNPVGWWKMDETTAIHGSTLADSSGYGNAGTLSTGDGSTNKSVAGKLGKGLSFDGVNDYVTGSTNFDPDNYNAGFSVSLWFNVTSNANAYYYQTRESAGWGSVILGVQGGSGALYYRFGTGVVGNGHTTGTNVPVNSWNHIVIVHATTSDKMYLNGTLIDSSVGGTLANNGTTIDIGSNQGLNYFINGKIDDVRIYNRALSAGEVGQMYNSTKDGYLGNIKVSTGLVGYWKLDDNNALTSVIDYSGKGNTGTANDGTAATSTSVMSTSTAMIGRAMSFDGSNDYILVNKDFDFDISKKFTFSTWVYFNSLTGWQTILGQDTADFGTLASFYFQKVSNASDPGCSETANSFVIKLPYSSSACNFYAARSTTIPVISRWYFIVGTFDGSNLRMYVNGNLENTVSTSAIASQTGNLSIGNGYFNNLKVDYFNGLIDEVKIWNYARSAEQIKQDYERGLRGLP